MIFHLSLYSKVSLIFSGTFHLPQPLAYILKEGGYHHDMENSLPIKFDIFEGGKIQRKLENCKFISNPYGLYLTQQPLPNPI